LHESLSLSSWAAFLVMFGNGVVANAARAHQGHNSGWMVIPG
jgi:glycerol uptake facilitator-like aquaporin